MPVYEIESPDGKILEIEGDSFPSETELDEIFKSTQTQEQKPQQEQQKGIDLTPSGIVKDISTNEQTIQQVAPVLLPMLATGKFNQAKELFNSAKQQNINNRPETPIQDLVVDLAGYMALPVLRGGGAARFAGNAAIRGGIPGASEELKNNGNVLAGAALGTGIGAGVQGLAQGLGKLAQVPQVANVGRKIKGLAEKIYTNAYPGLSSKTVKQAIKPNSKALELNEDTAQNLLTDTTERIQKTYQKLMDNAGEKVSEAARNLPPERGVYDTALKNALDDIYASYSTSGNKAINPAFNNAGDIYEDVSSYIAAAADPANKGKISASALNDIMGNIKNYNIDWNKTSAKDKQAILKQIYNDFSRRLNNLSPELRKANKEYSKLANFTNNEGVRRIVKPDAIRNENIDSASQVLRNYNKTISSGNKNRNIQDLEKILVDNGYEPFLNTIDDINAANELLKSAETGINPLGLLDKGKYYIEKPLLYINRGLNQLGEKISLPDLSPLAQRLLTPLVVEKTVPKLTGGVSYNETR